MSLAFDSSARELRNILSKFGQGAFYAYATAAQGIPTGATPTAVTVDNEVVDVCSWFDANTFTPKQPGYYLLFGRVHVIDADFTDGTDTMYLYIRKNGTAAAYRPLMTFRYIPLSDIVILEANGKTDAFDLAVVHNDAQTIDIAQVSFGGVFVSYNNP